MAHFYGEISGNRGPASRCGSKASGMSAHVRGWRIGARVYVFHADDGRDVVQVFKTSGSNGSRCDEMIAEFREDR